MASATHPPPLLLPHANRLLHSHPAHRGRRPDDGNGSGFQMILHGMNAERCLLAGEALGLGYAALTRAAQYARERNVFARPIGMNLGIAHPLADACMKLEGAKLATYHAAAAAAAVSGEQGGASSIRPDEVGVACNSAKYMAAEAAFAACERALLTHGGMGYAMEYDVERWFRKCQGAIRLWEDSY